MTPKHYNTDIYYAIEHPFFSGPVLYFSKKCAFLYFMNGGYNIWWVDIGMQNILQFLDECAEGKHDSTLGTGSFVQTFDEALREIFFS